MMMNPIVWQIPLNRRTKRTENSRDSSRITELKYCVSSDGTKRKEKLSLKTSSASLFCLQEGNVYKVISTRRAKTLMSQTAIVDVKCANSGPHYAYITMVYNSKQSDNLYVEMSLDELKSNFDDTNIGSFLVKYIKGRLLLKRTKNQIASKQRYYGKSFPSIISKIEKFKKLKKAEQPIPNDIQLSELEDELSSWIGTSKHHEKELNKIATFLFF